MKVYLNENSLERISFLEEVSKAKAASKKRRPVPCNGIKEKKGFSCYEELYRGKGTGKFYIATHRARSKSYDSLEKIPMKDINFIDSTS